MCHRRVCSLNISVLKKITNKFKSALDILDNLKTVKQLNPNIDRSVHRSIVSMQILVMMVWFILEVINHIHQILIIYAVIDGHDVH